MSKLREKQSQFVRMVGLLILKATELGYDLTFGDCYRDSRCNYGHKKSTHRIRLAVDFNLFINGEYIGDERGHKELHEYWSSIGGSKPIKNDMNHYSLEHDGVR